MMTVNEVQEATDKFRHYLEANGVHVRCISIYAKVEDIDWQTISYGLHSTILEMFLIAAAARLNYKVEKKGLGK